MARLLGASAIVWTPSSSAEHVLELRAPLRAIRPSVKRRVWVRESLDFSARSVTSVGNGVHEIVGRIRYEDSGQTLLDMLLFGQGGGTLTYIPDVNDQDVSYDVFLVDVGDALTAEMDSDRGFPGHEDLEYELRLRRTDGTAFSFVST